MAERQKRDFEPLPYYRWYWRDWRSSRTVQRMDWQARGLYRELLDECWAKGCIPDDIVQLADICGCPVEVMRTHWNTIEQMFAAVGDGILINERLENERTESDKTRVAKSLAGIRSGIARRLKAENANTDEQNRTDVPGARTSSSSSSSSSEQSKSSAGSSAGAERPAVAALAREAARAPAEGWNLIRDTLGIQRIMGFRPPDDAQ